MNAHTLKSIGLGFIALVLISATIVCVAQDKESNADSQITSTIKKASGVETVEFDTLVGKVEVNFPDDMSDTDTISGTVLVEPKGETKQEIAQNEDTLRGYVIEIEKTQEIPDPPPPAKTPPKYPPTCPPQNQTRKYPPTCPPRTQTRKYPPTCPPRNQTPKYPPTCPPGSMTKNSGEFPGSTGQPPCVYVVPGCRGSFTAGIPKGCGGVKVVVKNGNGAPVCSLPVPTKPIPPKAPPGCKFPPSCTSGGPLCIPGKTDGRSCTSTVKVNGQTCEPICESPRQIVAQTPPGLNGPCTVTVTECGQTTRGTVKMLPTCSFPTPKQPQTGKSPTFVFRRTGPFVEITEDSFEAIKSGYKATVTENQINFLGPYSYYANGNLMHDFAKASITFTPPPERITAGDEFSMSASVSGDKNYLEVPYAGPRGNWNGDGHWVQPNISTIPQLNLDPGRNESTSITCPFKVSDRPIQLRKMFEQQYKGNVPDQAKAQLVEMENRQPNVRLYGLSGIRVLVEWIYVREK